MIDVSAKINLIGQKFGRLTVVDFADSRKTKGGQTRSYWLCQCECGSVPKEIEGAKLKNGDTKSCGCLKKQKIKEKLIGNCFGNWLVLQEDGQDSNGNYLWLCQCQCIDKTIRSIPTNQLISGNTKSCGCSKNNKPREDLTGNKFGKLTVIGLKDKNSKSDKLKWICKCDCGNTREICVTTYSLTSGKTKSCGCYQKEVMVDIGKKNRKYKREGYYRLYTIWRGMKKRTNDKSDLNYGGRGITVCKEWGEYLNFKEWALNNGYSDELTIDRINNDGNYEPSNCRWATPKEQSNNTRRNVVIEYNGEYKTISEWSNITGIREGAINKRYKAGWSAEKIFTTPVKDFKIIKLEYKGKTLTFTEWSNLVGIKSSTLRNRYKKGWTAEQILTIPPNKQNRIQKEKLSERKG